MESVWRWSQWGRGVVCWAGAHLSPNTGRPTEASSRRTTRFRPIETQMLHGRASTRWEPAHAYPPDREQVLNPPAHPPPSLFSIPPTRQPANPLRPTPSPRLHHAFGRQNAPNHEYICPRQPRHIMAATRSSRARDSSSTGWLGIWYTRSRCTARVIICPCTFASLRTACVGQ